MTERDRSGAVFQEQNREGGTKWVERVKTVRETAGTGVDREPERRVAVRKSLEGLVGAVGVKRKRRPSEKRYHGWRADTRGKRGHNGWSDRVNCGVEARNGKKRFHRVVNGAGDQLRDWGRRWLCGALHGVCGKGGAVVSEGTRDLVVLRVRLSDFDVGLDERVAGFVKAIESIDVDHHAGGPVHTGKVVSEELLRETGEGMDRAFVV